MKLKNFLNYVKFSGIWIGFVLNPYHWEFRVEKTGPTDTDPNAYMVAVYFGPFWVRAILDDGSW